eukprot:7534223-Ditylum_brightwellii.AAC.1
MKAYHNAAQKNRWWAMMTSPTFCPNQVHPNCVQRGRRRSGCNEQDLYSAYRRVHSILDFPRLEALVCDNINTIINTSGALQQDIQEEMVEDDTIVNIHTQEESQSSTTPTFNNFHFNAARQAPATTTAPTPTHALLYNYSQ